VQRHYNFEGRLVTVYRALLGVGWDENSAELLTGQCASIRHPNTHFLRAQECAAHALLLGFCSVSAKPMVCLFGLVIAVSLTIVKLLT
jgi:hypothetical protein